MAIENNGPDAAYPGPGGQAPDTGEDHDSGLERSPSEPKQGTDERPEDWNPPPGTPASEQDELGFDPDSPDLSDPQIDPPHPARTSNDPAP